MINVDKKSTEYQAIHVFTDGGSRGNPGPSASGYVIQTPDGAELETGGEYLGVTTNNQAEYQAVKLALQMAGKFNPQEINFFMDSELVVKQLNGQYKIRNRDLWPIHSDIKKLVEGFKSVTFTHVRREQNKEADAEVNKILDKRLTS